MDGFSTMAQTAAILLREGIEALLIIAVLAGALRRSGHSAALRHVYSGVGAAVLASIAAAVAMARLLGGAHDDRIEAVVMIVTAGLMFYMSGWLWLKQDGAALAAGLRAQAEQALSRGALWSVAAVAFLAVFREGAETALFLHALAQTSGGWSAAMALGLGVAAAGLVAVYLAMQWAAIRLPLRPVFVVTSALLFVMALRFVGAAIQDLQEQTLLPFDEIGAEVLAPLGFNPSWEALIPQLAILAAALAGVALARRRAALTPAR